MTYLMLFTMLRTRKGRLVTLYMRFYFVATAIAKPHYSLLNAIVYYLLQPHQRTIPESVNISFPNYIQFLT